MLSEADTVAVGLTLKLAAVTTAVLVATGKPVAWWLGDKGPGLLQPSRAGLYEELRNLHFGIREHGMGAICNGMSVSGGIIPFLPLVLPSAVLGFYLLLLLGPHGLRGRLTQALGLGTLPFTFGGLVVASSLYSLPFVVQPPQNAFEAIGPRPFGSRGHVGRRTAGSLLLGSRPARAARILGGNRARAGPHDRGVRRRADDGRQHPGAVRARASPLARRCRGR